MRYLIRALAVVGVIGIFAALYANKRIEDHCKLTQLGHLDILICRGL